MADKKTSKPVAPSSIPMELSSQYRSIYSERQFTRIDGDQLIIGFLSRDRRYSGSSVEVLEDGAGFRPGDLIDETAVEVQEVTVKMPLLRALELSELIGASIRNLGPERLKQFGLQIKPREET